MPRQRFLISPYEKGAILAPPTPAQNEPRGVQPTAMDGPPRMKRLFQGVENKAGMGCPAHPPADDAASIGVDDKGGIDEASPSGHVGKVRDLQPIRCRSVELAIDLFERARRGLVADCRADRLAADHPLQAHLPHQPLNSAASDIEAFPLQLPPHLAHAVDTEVLFENASAGAWCGDSFSSATATVAGRAGRPDGSKLTNILYRVRHGGDWWAPGGLQSLCRACHFSKSRRERAAPNPERDAWKAYLKLLDTSGHLGPGSMKRGAILAPPSPGSK